MKKKILIIDDKAEFRILLKIILSENYIVQSVQDTLHALTLLQNGFKPNLIISNDAEQLSVENQLQQNEIFENIPILNSLNIRNSYSKTEFIEATTGNYMNELLIKFLTINLIG